MVPVIAQDDALRHKNSYKVVVKDHALSYPKVIPFNGAPWMHMVSTGSQAKLETT